MNGTELSIEARQQICGVRGCGKMLEFADNPEDRCPVMFALDTSASMVEQGKIDDLNTGLAQFSTDVLSDPIASLRVEVSVVAFGGAVQVIRKFATADNLNLPPLEASGDARLGEAINRALDEIERRKMQYRLAGVNYYRPCLWLLSATEPADEWQLAAARVRKAEADKKVAIFCVGVGRDANMTILKEFCPAERPPMHLQGIEFSPAFKWLSASARESR